MEFSVSGNALKTFSRSIGCLARIGNELVVQAFPSQLALHTLNASRSAYQSIKFKSSFFDVYTISGPRAQHSVLLKAVCSALRTPIASIDRLSVQLPDHDASKVKWSLECYSGMKKIYWITCNIEPDIQHLSLDRTRFPCSLVVQPRNMNKLLGNFQSSLQEITIIATDPASLPSDNASDIGGKAVELRSYVDPTKDSDSLLHTQLWIDPFEEFLQYTHVGDPVDITFSVKELKAFITFCEGCEADLHLFFEKAGEPLLMAPKFGLDEDGSRSNCDAMLVLATMLGSQLQQESAPSEPPQAANSTGDHTAGVGSETNVSGHQSDHTRIWSELSGSASKSGSGSENRAQAQDMNLHGIRAMQISKDGQGRDEAPAAHNFQPRMEMDKAEGSQGRAQNHCFSQRHLSNWVDPNDDDDDDDDGDETELFVQATPTYCEDH